MICAAPSAVSLLTALASPPAALDCTWPNAPNSTFVNERFIARHMMIDRIKPDGAIERPGRHQQLVVEHKAQRHGGQARRRN